MLLVEGGGLRVGQLRVLLELGNGSGDLDKGADLREGGGVLGVDEDAVGGVARVLFFLARARGLDHVAVQAAVRVGGGDHAAGGHGLVHQRAGGAGALNVRDGDDTVGIGVRARGRGGVVVLVVVVARGVFSLVVFRVSGIGRGGVTDGEVRRVVVGVGAVLIARCRGSVRRSLRRSALELGGLAVTGQVNRRVVGVDEFDGAVRTAHGRVTGRVRGRQRLGSAGALGFRDQVVTAGFDAAGQWRRFARVAGFAEVLGRPAGQIDVVIGRVVQLNEVIGVGGALVAATAVDLGDDDVVAGRSGRCRWDGDIREGGGGDRRDGEGTECARGHEKAPSWSC